MHAEEDPTIDRLIDRARHGDEQALSRLLELHSRRLLDSVRAKLGQRARQRLESQDVMQEVYVDALRNIDGFVAQGSDSFFAWLRQIALNRIRDVARREFQTQKRGREIRHGDLGDDESVLGLFNLVSASLTSPSAAIDRAGRVQTLRNAIEQLNPAQQEVVRYRYLQQLDVAQTAAKMDRTEEAVRSLCVRAIIRLRELLANVV